MCEEPSGQHSPHDPHQPHTCQNEYAHKQTQSENHPHLGTHISHPDIPPTIHKDIHDGNISPNDEPHTSKENNKTGSDTLHQAIPSIHARVVWSDSPKRALVVWSKTMVKILPVLSANILSLWIYFLPAMTLSPEMLGSVKEVVYEQARDFLNAGMFWISISMASIEVFSFRFSRYALFCSLLPGYLMDSIFNFLLQSNKILRNMMWVNLLFWIGCGLFMIYKSKRPQNMTQREAQYFSTTKDGSVSALLKGLLAYYFLVVFFFYNILVVYLDSPFIIQLVFRFAIFPICFHLSNWLQMNLISGLSEEHMDKRLIINKLCNHYIQLFGRGLISNISANGALSLEFVMVNLAAALIEILSTMTLEHRLRVLFRA